MAWTDVSGNVGPLGSSVGTISLDGNTWTLFPGSNGSNPTYSFVRTSNETSGTVNIRDLLKYLENPPTGHPTPADHDLGSLVRKIRPV